MVKLDVCEQREGSGDFALFDVTLYQQDERGVCPCVCWCGHRVCCIVKTWRGLMVLFFFWDHACTYLPIWHQISPLPCAMCLFSFAVRLFFLEWGFGNTLGMCRGFWKGIGQNQGRQGLAHDLLKQDPTGRLIIPKAELVNRFVWTDLLIVLN